MKKIILVSLSLLLIFFLGACSNKEKSGTDNTFEAKGINLLEEDPELLVEKNSREAADFSKGSLTIKSGKIYHVSLTREEVREKTGDDNSSPIDDYLYYFDLTIENDSAEEFVIDELPIRLLTSKGDHESTLIIDKSLKGIVASGHTAACKGIFHLDRLEDVDGLEFTMEDQPILIAYPLEVK